MRGTSALWAVSSSRGCRHADAPGEAGENTSTGAKGITDETDIDVCLRLDVGKSDHHATAVNRAGKKVFDKPLPNSEPKLRELFDKLRAKHGTVLVVVDQPASIGALPLAVARDAGCQVAYLPGLTMRRIADLYPGEAKTDARDAFIIADAARAMPHTLRTIEPADGTVAELAMIAGFDDDLLAVGDACASGWTAGPCPRGLHAASSRACTRLGGGEAVAPGEHGRQRGGRQQG